MLIILIYTDDVFRMFTITRPIKYIILFWCNVDLWRTWARPCACIGLQVTTTLTLTFYRACSAVLPRKVVCPSVCNVEVSWSYRLEFCENNFTADLVNHFTLCRPQHDVGLSAPKGTPPNFNLNRSGVRKIVDFRHLSSRISEPVQGPSCYWPPLARAWYCTGTGNISETVEDRAKSYFLY